MIYLWVVIFIFSICATIYRRTRREKDDDLAKFWVSLPAVGVERSRLHSWTWAALSSITKTADLASQGYNEFCKKFDKGFILPKAGVGAIVVLPPSQLHLLNKAEDELIAYKAQLEVIQPRYMTRYQDIYENPIHFEVVRQHLTRDVGTFATLMAEELEVAFRHCWGDELVDWKTTNVWNTSTRVISQVSNRLFFGLPLCRSEELLKQTTLYAASVYQMAALLSSLPEFLRPLFGPLLAIPARRQLKSCQRLLRPMVAARLDDFTRNDGTNMPVGCSLHALVFTLLISFDQNDALQWMIEKGAKAGKSELEPANLAERLLNLNLVSSWTTSYAFSYCMLDLYSSACKDDFVAGLRSECDLIKNTYGTLGFKEAVDKMWRIDSAVRESLRISPFSVVALPRIVPPGSGLNIGKHILIPPGVRISFPFQAMHHDPDIYENPLEYDAFRFSRQYEGPKGHEVRDEERLLSTSASESYITYGYGKHVCPGRWLASQMLKQALAHVLLHYDVECVEPLEPRVVIFNTILPQKAARVRVRRRTST